MQFNSNTSDTIKEISNFVSKLDTLEQEKILKSLKIREAKKLAAKISGIKPTSTIGIDEICATIRKIRKSNAKLPTR